MGAHTAGSRRYNSSTRTSTARLTRTRLPVSSAAVVPSPTSNGAACGKARRKAPSRRRDAEVVRRKMEALRRLVPSAVAGAGDEADELLLRAAGYIARLQAQVMVMQLMVDVLEHAKD